MVKIYHRKRLATGLLDSLLPTHLLRKLPCITANSDSLFNCWTHISQKVLSNSTHCSASSMPMLTDPAQQSTNRTAGRSELSSNWRVKIDATPTAGNNAATRAPYLPSQPDYCQQRDFRSRSEGIKGTKSEKPRDGGTLRGEDDPDTLQAIAEGKRLYVGNMPYMAKTKDVQLLFAEAGFHM